MNQDMTLLPPIERRECPTKNIAWETRPNPQRVEQTLTALRANGFNVDLVSNRKEALEKVRSLTPEGASIMTGSSTTIDQIGFVSLLKSGAHPWVNLKVRVISEKDSQKRMELGRQAMLADYFVGSAQAVTQNGQLVAGSGTGSQIAAYAFMAKNLILVVGTHKITSDLEEALKRLRDHCVPLEDKRMKVLGWPGTILSKIFIYEKEPRKEMNVWVILVNEPLGF
jgi:L-lactate utilization protein LutC